MVRGSVLSCTSCSLFAKEGPFAAFKLKIPSAIYDPSFGRGRTVRWTNLMNTASNDITLIDWCRSVRVFWNFWQPYCWNFNSYILKRSYPTEKPIHHYNRAGLLPLSRWHSLIRWLLWIGSLMIYWFGNPLESSIKWTKRPTVRLRPVKVPVNVIVYVGSKYFHYYIHKPFQVQMCN